MASGNLSRNRDTSHNDAVVVQWLCERYNDYKEILLNALSRNDTSNQSTALALIMRLFKEEATHLRESDETLWRTGTFAKTLKALIDVGPSAAVQGEFMQKYFQEYEDVGFHTFAILRTYALAKASENSLANVLSLLATVKYVPEAPDDLKRSFIKVSTKPHEEPHSFSARKKEAQDAWLAVLRQPLNNQQRKSILGMMSNRIVPWFSRVELLMDFLTDSFDEGGSMSLMALSGLFDLIQRKNLDYPRFYHKLYSMLDYELMHSKHRSRFFRLLETFLSSTHLPAALVASFVKRLSRLALNSPPAAIVAIVPLVYNLLKSHPMCTFMIHRVARRPYGKVSGDRFQMEESDPLRTHAIESSLWEIHTLQDHYHPNVAVIAKIISHQFTKQAYNLDDFLDHSYDSMLHAEVSKDVKKRPEIEPGHFGYFTTAETPIDDLEMGSSITRAMMLSPEAPYVRLSVFLRLHKNDRSKARLLKDAAERVIKGTSTDGSAKAAIPGVNVDTKCFTPTSSYAYVDIAICSRDKCKEDVAGTPDPPGSSPAEFTFMRSDTNTQELIQPPTFADEGDVPTPVHEHHASKIASRFRSSSNASTTSKVSSKGEKRLSQRLHLRSASRASSISSIVPADLPAIEDAADGSEEKEARWEERATILAQGNHTMSQDSAVKEAKGSLHNHGNSKPAMTRSISDAKGDETIQEAIRLHEAGDLEQSTAMFGRLADSNAMAQILYGLALRFVTSPGKPPVEKKVSAYTIHSRHGWGTTQNPSLGLTYLSQAASNSAAIESQALQSGMKKGGAAKGELVLAMYELANSFRHGWGVEMDPVAARSYYETAANLGDTDAMNEVARCYEEGFGGKKDKYKAAQYYRLAEQNGNKTLGNSCSFRNWRVSSTPLRTGMIGQQTLFIPPKA
ncbi:MAG: hypothetical protein Q9195_002012 [Heterodermia aff. obscurata]